MALAHAHGAIQWLAADAVGITYTVSGLSFQPKAIRFYWQGMASATDAVSQTTHENRGVGFATSTTNRRAVGTHSQDGLTAANCAAVPVDLAVAVVLDNVGSTTGLLDINAINADGYQLIVDFQITANLTIFWEAWGGTDISVAEAGHFFSPAAIGNQDYTVSGFVAAATDQVVMFAGCWGGVINTANEIDSCLTVGFASSGAAADNVHITGNSDEASATMDTDGYCKTGECLSSIANGGGNPTTRAQLTQFNTDGFRLNWIARVDTSRAQIYLAIKGGSWKAGSYTIDGSTLNSTATVSGLSFAPKGVSLIARLSVESTAGTSVAGDVMGLGSGSSTTDRRSMGMWDENGTGNAELDHTIQYDQVLSFASNAGALLAAYDINAMNSDGFQIITDVAGGVASEWQGYLTFGDAPTGGQTIGVAQAAETNAAQAIAVIVGALIIGLSPVSEADAAQALTPTQGTTISVGQTNETDAAQVITPVPGVVTVTVGQVTEADVAQVIGVQVGTVTISVSQTAETDTAQSIALLQGISIAVGQATETDTAQPIAVVLGTVTVAVGQASETDVAQTISAQQGTVIAVGQATEVDTAQPISVIVGAVTVVIGQAAETDTAQIIAPQQGSIIAVGQATESDLSQPISVVVGTLTVAVGQVGETDEAQAITVQQGTVIAIGQASETDTAQSIIPIALGTVARPNADTTPGSWLPSTGSVLYDMVDEVIADDADYIYATTATTCKLALSPVADPGTSSGQVVSYRAWSPTGNGVIVRLKQGAVTIATWTHAVLPTSPTTYQQALSGAECDAITNYSLLSVEFESTT